MCVLSRVLQYPLSMGISRQEYWSGLPFPPPGSLPDPGIESGSLLPPSVAGGFFTMCHTYANWGLCVCVPRCVWLFAFPLDCSQPGFSVHGGFQARILKWVATPFSRGSSQPRNQTWVSCSAGRFFAIWVTREAYFNFKKINTFYPI